MCSIIADHIYAPVAAILILGIHLISHEGRGQPHFHEPQPRRSQSSHNWGWLRRARSQVQQEYPQKSSTHALSVSCSVIETSKLMMSWCGSLDTSLSRSRDPGGGEEDTSLASRTVRQSFQVVLIFRRSWYGVYVK